MPTKDEVVEFLEEKLAQLKERSPGAWSIIASYEAVINDVMMEE